MKKQFIAIICTFLVLGSILGGCMALTGYKEYYPQEGIWFCEELQIQLGFDHSDDCFILIDDMPIRTVWENDRGSRIITVLIQDEHPDYDLGESVFTGEFIGSDDNSFIVQDCKGTARYIFEKQGQGDGLCEP